MLVENKQSSIVLLFMFFAYYMQDKRINYFWEGI